MIIQIMSDLHITWQKDNFMEDWPKSDPDLVIIAGDQCENSLGNIQSLAFFEKLCSRFREVVYVPGNHDFYLCGVLNYFEKLKHANLPRNLHILNNEVFEFGGYRILGTPLWYPFRPEFPNFTFSDFIFIPDLYFQVDVQHKEAMRFLSKHLPANRYNGDTIVVTHNAPSQKSSSPVWTHSDINHYFVTPLDGFIVQRSPKLWIHGHLHHCCDYSIMDTRIISNSYGYTNERTGFNNNLLIEI